jgi:DNA-binding response OmpR family regulator
VSGVLVVDDDPMVGRTIEVCLQRQDFEVTVADGGEADTRALEFPAFDVAGFDTTSPDFLRMPLELGATVCQRKPLTPNALLPTVNECLEKSIASARLSQ